MFTFVFSVDSSMKNKIRYLFWIGCMGVILSISLFSCGRGARINSSNAKADSLNQISFAYRYKDLSYAAEMAHEAYLLLPTNPTIWAQTLNNLGFCAFMQMDFDKAMEYYGQVSEETNNEIEGLVADVGMMKICQRVSLNKEFFDYRNQALRRMKRIGADYTVMADSELASRYNFATSEFYIVSSIYYYYLQQDKESVESITAISDQMLAGDTAQWLYRTYMKGSGAMYADASMEDRVVGEFGSLLECLDKAHNHHYTYFEANALQAMAELLNFESNRNLLSTKRLAWLNILNPEGLPMDSLPLFLANHALRLFKEYGDNYQISGTYRTIATYYNSVNQPEKALVNLKEALEYVNRHHEKYYHCTDTLHRLLAYRKKMSQPVESKWVNDKSIKTVPEWIARLREQLSRTYSAMGMKAESDYNRNIYLDLLDYTRQDKELESRYATLESESRKLNLLSFFVGLVFVVLFVLFIYLNRFWKKSYSHYLDELRTVLDLCRTITAAVPQQASDRDEVVEAIRETAGQEILMLTGADEWWITWSTFADESEEGGDADIEELTESDANVVSDVYADREENVGEVKKGKSVSFPLIAPGKDHPVAYLWLQKQEAIHKDEQSLIQLILPYLAWTLENGLNLASLSDERMRLEKEQYIHLQHLIENKRQNEVKKTCLAIVTGIVPYIDRVVNEIHKLQHASFAQEAEIKRGKLNYISELSSKINDYNDILAQWIKMRQGALSLNIENFELQELFKVIVKGRRTFEMKHQHLIVEDTSAVVKADKALTLFMINTLTENARKYVNEGGFVKVYAEETDTYVEVSVTDNGPGLSEKDVHRILSEKVYDSGKIGMDTATDVSQLQKQKGHGFGLMNCKGIIDKYKKTNPFFNVCLFSIESELGKGSRFYFRLPKGVRRMANVFLPILFMCCMGVASCSGKNYVYSGTDSEGTDNEECISLNLEVSENKNDSLELREAVAPYDSLLAIANYFANKVYDANVEGRYSKALELADSVLFYMNSHFKKYGRFDEPLAKMYDKGQPAELVWLANNFDTDYFIMLDVRNEIAIACLALKDFDFYYYNNLAYTTLYKQLSEDNSLEEYCIQMQRSSNNKTVALTLFVVMSVGFVVMYYLTFWRRKLHYRFNVEQVFSINRAAFTATAHIHQKLDELRERLVKDVFQEVNELLPIENLIIAVKEEGVEELRCSSFQTVDEKFIYDRIRLCYESREIDESEESMWYYVPLCVNAGPQDWRVGVMALNWSQPSVHEEDKLLVKLIAGYLAVVLYNSIVQVERKYLDIELAQDEARRASYEENLLHVQNLVLDNCLSTIKHETIYYPNRIRQIAERMLHAETNPGGEENSQLADMAELVSYYKDVFTILASCAARQLDEVTFRRSEIQTEQLVGGIRKYYKKITRKLRVYPELVVESESLTLVGDEILLNFLFENLLNEAVQVEEPGRLHIKIALEHPFVRFDFTDSRRTFTQDELNSLFYPDHAQLTEKDGLPVLKGTEYLVCKQIIREHDEFAGRRGCRINACNATDGQGFTVWFTIPARGIRQHKE